MRVWFIISSWLLILVADSGEVFCQSGKKDSLHSVTLIRAVSRTADIRVNGVLEKGVWNIDPTIKEDVYYLRRSKWNTKITVITDIDSVVADLGPGQSFDFVILLNGKDSCFSSIRSPHSAKRECMTCRSTADTIPFTLGADNRIYFEGRINSSETLKILYDNGAELTGLTKSAAENKVRIKVDGVSQARGTGGVIETQASNGNKVQIGTLTWDDEYITAGFQKFGRNADAIVGYSLFADKIVEIDYEHKIFIVHDEFPSKPGYARADVKFYDFMPFVSANLVVNGKSHSDLYFIDIGGSGTVAVNAESAARNNLYNSMEVIGNGQTTGIGETAIETQYVVLPKLVVEGHELQDVPISMELPSGRSKALLGNLLGMDLLKRFNMIIDYQRNEVYMKPNNLLKTPFKQPGTGAGKYWIGGGILLLMLVSGVVVYFSKRRKSMERL